MNPCLLTLVALIITTLMLPINSYGMGNNNPRKHSRSQTAQNTEKKRVCRGQLLTDYLPKEVIIKILHNLPLDRLTETLEIHPYLVDMLKNYTVEE